MNETGEDPYSHLTRQELVERLQALEALEARRKQAEESLRESEEKYRVLLDDSSDPIFTFFPDGTYRFVNKAFADGVGKRVEDIINHKIWDVFSQEEADKRFAAVKWVYEHGEMRVIEVRVPRPDGDHYYITTVKPIFNQQGEVSTIICISKEITERKRMEEELRFLSIHDTLTGLFNRAFFEAEITRLQQGRSFPISVVMADLDGLKQINDTQGHAAGDALLQQTARVMKAAFRAEDILARLGGDEFAVLLPETGAAAAQAAMERLRSGLEKENNPQLQLSVGVSTCEQYCDLHGALRSADDRMYADKSRRRRERRKARGAA